MTPSISLYSQIRDYSRQQKTDLKALWEDFLASEWDGHTYNDFVLKTYVQCPKLGRNITMYDRRLIMQFLEHKTRLSFENLRLREKIKIIDWRTPHYKSCLYYNRSLINSYNDLIFKILGGNGG